MSKKFQLKNGLTVLLVESHKSPVVSVQMWVHTGSADEKKGEEGISHFIEHLVFKGTKKFGVGQIASTVEGSGGELNAYTSFDQTVFYVTISSQYSETGLEVISEMMGFPTFDNREIDNEREVVIEEIKRTNDSPHRQASRALFETLYKKHPYGIPVIGYDTVIRKVSRKTLQNYFHSRYVPQNMTLVVVGDFDSAKMKKQVNQYFGGFKKYPLKKIVRKKELVQKSPRVLVKQANFEETLLHLAWKVPGARHKDVPALDILAMILGQGDSSRLMRALRIEAPLTNYTGSSSFTPLDPGFLVVSSSLNFKNLEVTLKGILHELKKVLTASPTAGELTKAKINMESEEFYSLETVDGQARKFGHFEHLFKDHNYHKIFLKQVNALKPDDILRVAKKYLKSDTLTAVLMTKETQVEATKLLEQWIADFKKMLAEVKKVKAPAEKAARLQKIVWKPIRLRQENNLRKVELTGGANVILRPNTETPVISLRCAMLGGMRFEPKELTGLTELTSRVWVAGTQKLNEAEIHRLTESKASSLNAFGGRNSMGLTLTTLSPFADDMADLFMQTLTDSVFPTEVIEREKQMMLEQIKTRDDNPSQLAIRGFMEVMFGEHPYSRDTLGDADTVKNLTREAVLEHVRGMLKAGNLTLALTGDFKPEAWVQKLNQALKQVSNGNLPKKNFSFNAPAADHRVYKKSEKEQSHIVIGYPGLTFLDHDRYALQVIQSILAGQGGRLFLELRDKASLAYSVSPMRMEGIDAGYFGAYIGCSPDKGAKAISMLKTEFKKLTDEKVPMAELERAKRYLIGRHDIELQRNSAVGASILFDDIYGIPFDETFHYAEKLGSVNADQIQKLAQKIFSQPEVISVAGPTCPWD